MGRGSVRARTEVCSGVLGALTVTALLPLCDLLFVCGCTWAWAGGVDHCNLFHAGAPHCPWCIYPRTADLSLAALLTAQAFGAWVVARSRPGVWAPLFSGAFFGGAAAVVVRARVAWWAGDPV